MYIHQQDWDSAMRVAEKSDPSAVPDVCVAEARAAADRGDRPKVGTVPGAYVHGRRDVLIDRAWGTYGGIGVGLRNVVGPRTK